MDDYVLVSPICAKVHVRRVGDRMALCGRRVTGHESDFDPWDVTCADCKLALNGLGLLPYGVRVESFFA